MPERSEARADSDVDLLLVIDRPLSFGEHPLSSDESSALYLAALTALPPPAHWPKPGTDEYRKPYIEFVCVHAATPFATSAGNAEREEAIRAALEEGLEVWPGASATTAP